MGSNAQSDISNKINKLKDSARRGEPGWKDKR